MTSKEEREEVSRLCGELYRLTMWCLKHELIHQYLARDKDWDLRYRVENSRRSRYWRMRGRIVHEKLRELEELL